MSKEPKTDAEIWQKSLIDAALDAVMVIDEDGFLLDFNPAAEEMFGYTKAFAVGKEMAELIVPVELRDAHRNGLERLKSTKIAKVLGQRLELPAARSDGTEFPCELIVVQVPVRPKPLYVGYVRDISDRKRTEAELRESAMRFRRLADSATLMIWVADTDGEAEWFNRSWLAFTGQELEDVEGFGWVDLIHDEDRESYMKSYTTALKLGDPMSKEFRLRCADGTHRWVLANVAPTRQSDGTITAFSGSCVDIHTRREMEMALQLTQSAMDGAADAVFWIQPTGQLHYVNDQACHALGYAREELLGLSVTDFSVSIPDGGWDSHWKRLTEEGHGTFEASHRRKDGTEFPVEITVNLTDFEDDQFCCAFARDITERKEAQAALDEAMIQAQDANRAKSDFLALVSHEMRTPLNSILGTIELGLTESSLEKKNQLLEQCQKSGDRLKELINDMLDYNQIHSGRFLLQQYVLDINQVLRRIHTLFTGRASAKNLEFRWKVSSEIPELLVGDERRLFQIIVNLLQNAVKFTDSGYVGLFASVHELVDDVVTLKFTVVDSGIGIAPEDRTRIFGRFEQAESGTTRSFGGAGLGLSICAQLVELMQGEIHAEESDTGGARFTFTAKFPRPSETETSAFAAGQSPSDETSFSFEGITVLLAEDDPPSRMVAEQMLQNVGIEVVTAEDGVQAVEVFSSDPGRFDAIVMDMMMPRLDGIGATERIREHQVHHVPIVALTAQAMIGDRERILRSHVDKYLSKPIHRKEILQVLAQLLTEKSVVPSQTTLKQTRSRQVSFDYSELLKRCNGDLDLLAKVGSLFCETCDETMAALRQSLKSLDQPTVVDASHRLKGSVANMCAVEAFDLCSSIEQAARDDDLQTADSLFQELEDVIPALCESIRQRLEL